MSRVADGRHEKAVFAHVPILTPERKLWRAVLEQAFEDAEIPVEGNQRVPRRRKRAREYLRGDGLRIEEGLDLVCGYAALRSTAWWYGRDSVIPWLPDHSLPRKRSMIRRTTYRKANGHAGPNGRPNGHGPATAERGEVPEPACPAGSPSGLAASVDASGSPSADAAVLAAAASTDCQTYAAAAPPPPLPASCDANKENQPSTKEEPEDIPPGETPLPPNARDFVEEIHRQVDMFEMWIRQLRSDDEKTRQRALEKLTEMAYKGAAALADEPQRIIIDMPGPTRD